MKLMLLVVQGINLFNWILKKKIIIIILNNVSRAYAKAILIKIIVICYKKIKKRFDDGAGGDNEV